MNGEFCTYFDHRYAPKGLAMWRSLKRWRPASTLHVLCLSQACREILEELRLTDVHLYSLADIERADPDLLRARDDRSLVEYYFTLTPCLPLYILKARPEVRRLTYVDADLFFFADPQPIFDEMGEESIALLEHRFPDELIDLDQYGRFNVGWLSFRNDRIAHRCLEVWRRQCIDWCYDRLEPGRFAEQKYLDEWPARYRRVKIVQHRGANVAPWNLNRFELRQDGAGVQVGGQPILFYHAHRFDAGGPGRLRSFNLQTYGVAETPLVVHSIYEPYDRAVTEAIGEIAVPLARALLEGASRTTVFQLETLKNQVESLALQLSSNRAARDASRALVDTLQATVSARADAENALRARLAATEAERDQYLGNVEALRTQLASSEAERRSQVEAIERLTRRVRSAEQESAALVDAAARLSADIAARTTDIETLRTALKHAISRVMDLEASLSWRCTYPLRRAADVLMKRHRK